MQMNLDPVHEKTIQAYDEQGVRINQMDYKDNLLVTSQIIHCPWHIDSISNLTLDSFEPILNEKIELILIGHKTPPPLTSYSLIEALSKRRIGIEWMSIGAATRTFNILLAEDRAVALGLIFQTKMTKIERL